MARKHQDFNISKLVVAGLIIVSIIGAAVVIWLSYYPVAPEEPISTSSSQVASDTNTADNDSASTLTEIDDEVSAIDKSISAISDADLSDSNISDSAIGL